MNRNVQLNFENADGKVYITFFDKENNYITGRVAIGSQNSFSQLPIEIKYDPREAFKNFLEKGYLF